MGPRLNTETNSIQDNFDAVIIGAGLSGLYQLFRLRNLGLKVKVLEAGEQVGGVWYWNRYPGARFDSESYSYGYSFSQEILDEWRWTEHFAPQPETERYINFVADKLDLRRDIEFNSRVISAHFQQDMRMWKITIESGETVFSRFMITAVGPLSTPTLPRYPGLEEFKGESCHTAHWPKSGLDYSGKRVAVIGTGATGIQTIQEVAKSAATLTVFQRKPNWCAPLHNSKISPKDMEKIRSDYPSIFERCQATTSCFLHQTDPRSALETAPKDREAFWEDLYAAPGFGIWMGNFRDVLLDREANKLLSDFIAQKIRSRVKDPETAELLIPKDHGFGTCRVPLETKYYEVYNQANVQLVDLKKTPIERITQHGIKTSNQDYEFDVIIYATGFDAVTGSFDRIDIRGLDGESLKSRWKEGPKTYLGLLVNRFPNMFMVMGPHTALGNIPRSIEYAVDWLSRLIAYAGKNQITYIDATEQGVKDWTAHIQELGRGLLSNDVDSWLTGVNSNIDGKQTRIIARYCGTAPAYRARCDRVTEDGYTELRLM